MNPKKVIVPLALSFWLLTPLITFLLLGLKGFPDFAQSHIQVILFWVYEVSWVPALLSAVLLGTVVYTVIRRTPYFHHPYDLGRSFSLGAITGALAHAFSTWFFRLLTHHPFSDFWIAGAMIAGCLAGAFLTAFFLRSV